MKGQGTGPTWHQWVPSQASPQGRTRQEPSHAASQPHSLRQGPGTPGPGGRYGWAPSRPTVLRRHAYSGAGPADGSPPEQAYSERGYSAGVPPGLAYGAPAGQAYGLHSGGRQRRVGVGRARERESEREREG